MKPIIKRIYPLSPMQKGMLFHKILHKESTAYFEQVVFDIEGYIDIDIFQDAFNRLLARYDILRTIFSYDKFPQPMQIVLEKRSGKVYYKELIGLEENDKEKYIVNIKKKDKLKGFDITKDVLIRAFILKRENNQYKFILSFHHIIMDGWCLGIIINDLMGIYHSIKNKQEIDLPKQALYEDYISWLEKQNKKNAEDYWKNYLEGYEVETTIPSKNQKKVDVKDNYIEMKFCVDENLTEKLVEISKKYKVTINTIVQAVWGILLQRYNNTDDVVFGAVVSGRDAEVEGIESMVGLFINTIPLRVKCHPNMTFSQLIEELQRETLMGMKYHYCDLSQIQSKTKLKNNLINNLLIFENYYIENSTVSQKKVDFEIKNIEVHEHTNYDFNIVVSHNKQLNFLLSVNEAVYELDFVESVGTHFKTVLEQVILNPNAYISDIEIVSGEDRNILLNHFNSTKADYENQKTLHKLFEEQVEKTPNNIALVVDDQEITYSNLNEKANQLARALIERGVEENNIVGLNVDRSIEMMIGILGILKAGAAYLPIDPQYPENRILYMLDNSKVEHVVYKKIEREIKYTGINCIAITDEKIYQNNAVENLESMGNADNLAYVIYTSGTTGKPKGVMIEHKQVNNFISGVNRLTGINKQSSILCITTICFDIFVLETLLPLLNGLKVIITKENTDIDGNIIGNLITNNKIDIMQSTPSRIKLLMENSFFRVAIGSLKMLLIGGEALPVDLLKKLEGYKNLSIYNMYGPTETTVWSTIKKIDINKEVTIGKPIQNTSIYIFDKNFKLQPIGVTGQLCIGGAGVAKGYINNEKLTKEKFIKNNYFLDERMYQTGDLARWLPNGEIEHLGRLDYQVKFRGYRIELGEIENCLLKIEGVREVAVILKGNNEDEKLYAYFVGNQEYTVLELREELRKYVPDYMIPSYFIRLDEMPLNSNGKIDRGALPEDIGQTKIGIYYEEARNEMEVKMVKLWEKILSVDKVGINDDFFILGGHSLKLIELQVELEKENIEIDLDIIYRHRTIKDIINFIENKSIIDTVSNKEDTEEIINIETEVVNKDDVEDSKIIKNIEPYNEIFFKSCFYNSLFPILRSYGKDEVTVLLNDVILYKFYENDTKFNLGITYLPVKPVEDIINEIGLRIETDERKLNLIEGIIEAIDKKGCVVIWVDCYYLPYRKDTYMKIHWKHTLLIYGYDKKNKNFNIIEHTHRDNLNYRKQIVSFDELISGYEGFIKSYNELPTYYEFYLNKKQDDSVVELEDRQKLKTFLSNIEYQEDKYIDQLKLILTFAERFKLLINNGIQLQQNFEFILNGLNDIINAKQVEYYKITKLFDSEAEVINILQNILVKWQIIRSVIVKCIYTSQYNEKAFESVINNLEVVYELELQYCNIILKYQKNIYKY